MENVCDSIHASLEGMKNYTKYFYENDYERKAYIDMFEQCQLLVRKHDLEPGEMLQALSDLHTDVIDWPIYVPFFSFARWFYRPNEAREKAVVMAFELVDSISKRYTL